MALTGYGSSNPWGGTQRTTTVNPIVQTTQNQNGSVNASVPAVNVSYSNPTMGMPNQTNVYGNTPSSPMGGVTNSFANPMPLPTVNIPMDKVAAYYNEHGPSNATLNQGNPNAYNGYNPGMMTGLYQALKGGTPTSGSGALLPYGGLGPQAGANAPQAFQNGGQVNHDLQAIKQALIGNGGL